MPQQSIDPRASSSDPSPEPGPDDLAADPFLWLEDVQGERALAWVRERNAETQAELESRPDFAPTRDALRRIFDSSERIPQVSRRGDWLYNLWQDEAHPRGLWRRTTLDGYRQAEPPWETVLDLDALATAEGENWVWAGAVGDEPTHRRCLVSLSRGGADAHVVREFDTVDKRFVEGGFALPEAKSEVHWLDADTLYVGTNFGPGSLTDSGYPRVVKRWHRGTPLEAAVTVFEGEAGDVAAGVWVDRTPGHERTVFTRSTDFFNSVRFLATDGALRPIDLPSDASFAFWNHAGGRSDILLVELRSDHVAGGVTYRNGSLIASDAAAFLRGEPAFQIVFEPTPTCSLAGYATTRSALVLNLLDQVASRLEEWRPTPEGGLSGRRIAAPHPGTLHLASLDDPMRADDPHADLYLLGYTDFLTPDTLMLGRAGSDDRETLRSLPASFDAAGLEVRQAFATSADGTRVPYFVVGPGGAAPDAAGRPTLLYGYGGFEISMQPWYAQTFGEAWLSRGGVLVLANIRGGGEFGPAWHQAAMKHHKQRSYDDFIAVAEQLIANGTTTPARLGIQGGSNGGLLVGAVFVQRPELFNAVVCQVPLLDMRRFHRLLAGASWMAEYGDPDTPDDWAIISRYSPYQNIREGVVYPRVFFTTSTRDDRVHPAHARKMAARMRSLGHPLLYYENIEGGHGGAADNAQRARKQALEFTYLWQQLGGAEGA